MDIYSDTPLDPESNQIRMLQIQPSWRPSSTIKCNLVRVDLDDLDADEVPFEFYEALSYTWGDTGNEKRISLNGCPFQVTRNLHAALRRLRARRLCRYLWVDALCINQKSVAERSSQVAKMSSIYKKAEQVLVWLGGEQDGSRQAIDIIDRMGDEGMEDWTPRSLARPRDLEKWRAVAKFLDRPYWRRVWIRQEVLLAPHIMILCGDKTLNWSDITAAAAILLENQEAFDAIASMVSPHTSGYRKIGVLEGLKEIFEKQGTLELKTVVFYHRDCECTDPRDRVYGGLGLCGSDTGVVIDYALSPAEVFINTTTVLIQSTNALDLLSGCQESSRDLDLPSWVPNFDADWAQNKLHPNPYTVKDVAGSKLPAQYSFDRQPGGHPVLTVKGLAVDIVAHASPPINRDEFINDIFDVWRDFASGRAQVWATSYGVEQRRSTFLRTVIANVDFSGDRPSDQLLHDLLDRWDQHSGIEDTDTMPSFPMEDCNSNFTNRFLEVVFRRILFVTAGGRIGVGPDALRPEDLVVVIFGASVPFILRKQGGHHTLVGEACKVQEGHLKPRRKG